MKAAAVTMCYNEAVNLPIWLRYYGGALGLENLFVIDHGSDEQFQALMAGANVTKLPRTPFDDRERSVMLSKFQNDLLMDYDFVIYTDCDEMIVPDPERFSSIPDYLSKLESNYATTVGLNVIHIVDSEPSLDLAAPILEQRSFVRFVMPMCKTLVSRIPLQWGSGFHTASVPPRIDPKLYLFHLKYIDLDLGLQRLAITRSMEWSSLKAGAHQRISDTQYVKYYQNAARLPVASGDFSFEEDLKHEHPGHQAPNLHRIPARFKGCL
jgi:hypothetical protein